MCGTSLVVQWLRMSCNAGDEGSIPSWGTKIPHSGKQLNLQATSFYALQRTILHDSMKIPHATTKT